MTTVIHQRKFISNLMQRIDARTQQELADTIGVNASVLSKLHHHPKPGMTLSTLVTISSRTGIKVSTLAGWLAGEDIKP